MKKKILILSPDHIGSKMAGPGIRYWNISLELSKFFDVILFTPNDCDLEADFTIKKISKKAILEESTECSCIILQGLVLWDNPYLKKIGVPLAIDLYDPFILENLESNNGLREANLQHKAGLAVLLDQLLYGDYFFCASDKQRDYWLGMLSAINRINPEEYLKDKTLTQLIGIVPFGLPNYSPSKNKNVLKGVYPGIEKDDKVVIWGGGVWDWLDPLTAIKAFEQLMRENEKIKLFFMGTKHPNANIQEMNMVKKARKLSDEYGLTNKTVFFNEWVNYNDRHNYLMESDIGLNLHFDHIETRFSFRTRMLDYIWCGLPIVSTQGDVMSEIISKHDIGITVPLQDHNQLAKTIQDLINMRLQLKRNEDIIKNLTWDKVILPLKEYCANPIFSPGKSKGLKVRGIMNSKLYYNLIKSFSLIAKGEYLIFAKKVISKFK